MEFFKVFLPEFSSHELVIPPAFIDILEKPLPNKASIVDEIGGLWCVETKLEETETRVRVVFKKGWENFVKDQSLGFGDFLVFKYDGDSRFFVTIYAKEGVRRFLTVDKSRVSVENEPVFATKPVDIARVSVEKEPVVSKPECSDSMKSCDDVRRRSWKSRRGFVAVDDGFSGLVKDEPVENVSICKIKPEHRENTRKRNLNRSREFDESWWVPVKKQKGLEELVKPVYKPKNPHFVRTITHAAIHRMEIPTTLLKSNDIQLEGDVELCDENGKKWLLQIVTDHRGMIFSKEWLSFVESHNLLHGNKCLFEFIVEKSSRRCNEIQVRIFRGRLDTIVTKNGYHVLCKITNV